MIRLLDIWHRPHVHGDGPARPYHGLPKLWEDYFTRRAYEIIVTLHDMLTEHVYMHESLFYQFFQVLALSAHHQSSENYECTIQVEHWFQGKVNFLPTASLNFMGSRTSAAEFRRKNSSS